MSIGIALPDGGPTGANVVDHLVRRATEARGAGLGAVWFTQRFDHDAVTIAALVGAAVPDIEIGTCAVPVLASHPIVMAGQARTAQAASRGRLTLGLGAGAAGLDGASFGVAAEQPTRHLREYLTVLNALFDAGFVDFAGETVTARTPAPAPVAGAVAPQVLVSAQDPQALSIAGELADGTLPLFAGPRTIAEVIAPVIAEAARDAGRRRPRIAAAVVVVVTDDVARVSSAVRHDLENDAALGSCGATLDREDVDHAAELAIIGDESHVGRELDRYLAAGATDLVAMRIGLGSEDDRQRTLALLGRLERARRR